MGGEVFVRHPDGTETSLGDLIELNGILERYVWGDRPTIEYELVTRKVSTYVIGDEFKAQRDAEQLALDLPGAAGW